MNDKCQHKFPNHATTVNETIFCLYCNREFRDEDIAGILKAQHDANVLQMEAKFAETQAHRSMSTPGDDHRDGKD